MLVDLASAPCLVVGGGTVATGKVRGLLAVDACVTVVAPDLSPALAALVDAAAVEWSAGRYAPSQAAQGWRFVIAATDDRATNALVVADAASVGIWANDASAPDGGPAALPAVHRSGPVTLAVATGGAHPGAAGWLRDLAATAIGPEHVAVVALAAEVRAESGDPGSRSRRPDWQAAVDSGMLDLIRTGRQAE
ncbi:MAG: precorrin-2 dehydrogenase/sirohydrochlorin ferrochelatase family protein, partial [Acidimicrobiales bacterium]